MNNKKKVLLLLLLTSIMMLVTGLNVQAKDKGWVTQKSGYTYYYRNGQKLTGIQTIGSKVYYFDENGIQRTSWRSDGEHYYYFRVGKKSKGSMLVNGMRNGIQLGPDGAAILSSPRAQEKARLMSAVSAWLDSIIRARKAAKLSRREKLRAVFDHLRKHYPYRYVGHFRKTDPNWDIWSVDFMMAHHYADCHPFACSFAYLANALGYNNIVVFSWYTKKFGGQGHSWVKIGKDRIYDVSLARHDKKSYELFGMKEKTYSSKYYFYKKKHTMKLNYLKS